MRIKLLTIAAVAALVLGPVHAVPSNNEQQQEPTPCEAKAIAIGERTIRYQERAKSDVPFTIGDNIGKSCGVLLRGIQELRDMSCPEDIVAVLVEAQKHARVALNNVNERYDMNFSCFVPEFSYL